MPPPAALRYTPSGETSEQVLADDIGKLLGTVRQRTDPYEYYFDATLDTPLHRSARVHEAGRASSAREGIVVDNPPYHDFMQLPKHKKVRVRWLPDNVLQNVPYSHLNATYTRAHEDLRKALAKAVNAYPRSTRTGNEPFRVRLHGSQLRVQAVSYDLAAELHGVLRARVPHTTDIRTVDHDGDDVRTRFYKTARQRRRSSSSENDHRNDDAAAAATSADPVRPRYHSQRQRDAYPCNRKRFSSAVRSDPWFAQYTDQNVMQQRGQTPCTQWQPHDLVGKAVVVPKWDTQEDIVAYVGATVVRVNDAPARGASGSGGDVLTLQVKKQGGAHTWDVPLSHVHPQASCQDVRRGSAVFVAQKGKPPTDTTSSFALGTIVNVHERNDTLDCGFAGGAAHHVRVPDDCTSADAWNDALDKVFDGKVRVEVVRGSHLVFRSTVPRFTVWATSTCAALLGFVAGCTYESVVTRADNSNSGRRGSRNSRPQRRRSSRASSAAVASAYAHVLRAPARVPLRHDVVHEVAFDVQLRAQQPLHQQLQQQPYYQPKSTTVTLDTLVPVRPQYSKDLINKRYSHLSAYQQFPIHYLTPERPQRGVLLYHETGSGKSRTSIEMAQRDIEHRYWRQPTQPSTFAPTLAPHDAGDRPRVMLFSPTQNALSHVMHEVNEWSACWWSPVVVSGGGGAVAQWSPVQHVYTKFHGAALRAEIRQHESAVGAYLRSRVYRGIVYTNNTNSLSEAMKQFYKVVEQRHETGATPETNVLKRYFGLPPNTETTLFDASTRTHEDTLFGRLFADTFVIVDEVHRLSNLVANATNADNVGRVSTSGFGTFFYRALMEAPFARIVGLSGTPMQRTPASFAPLFNLLRGKIVTCKVTLHHAMPMHIKHQLFAHVRPYAETVWEDLTQTGGASFTFTPWSRADVYTALFGTLDTHHTQPFVLSTGANSRLQSVSAAHARFHEQPQGWCGSVVRQYRKQVSVVVNELELFPFAFKARGRNARNVRTRKPLTYTYSRPSKVYAYDNPFFEEHFVKNGRLRNAVDFARRVVGLVSYISPPKAKPAPARAAATTPTSNDKDTYPEYTVRTVQLAAQPLHVAYLNAITKQRKEINQKKADTEALSGCNVNWNVVTGDDPSVLDGKQGLMKLFLKGKTAAQQTDEALEREYHALLAKVHAICAGAQPNAALSRALAVDGDLRHFAPKMYQVVHDVMRSPNAKAVVYSQFIDGVGKYGYTSPPYPERTPTSHKPSLPEHTIRRDTGHSGLSGLGLLGYVLERNGFVRLQVRVVHPLDSVFARFQRLTRGEQQRALITVRQSPKRAVSVDTLNWLCTDVCHQPALTPDERERLRTDIKWTVLNRRVSLLVLCSQFVRAPFANAVPHVFEPIVKHWRLALAGDCRDKLGLTSGTTPTTRTTHPRVFVEYSDRCIVNPTQQRLSKRVRNTAKDAVLRLYNLATSAALNDLANEWTPQAMTDLCTLLARGDPTPSRRSSNHVNPRQSARARKPPKRTSRQTRPSRRTRRNTSKGGDTTPATKTTFATAGGNTHAAIVQLLLVSKTVTESVEFKDVRAMHIMEPPEDYRQLEQMFGRVIRRGSHSGLAADERDVHIRLYVLTTPYVLDTLREQALGAPARTRVVTADEKYWGGVIKRKYEISQEFYQAMKYLAVDCRQNLVLNSASAEDKALTCFEYPYQTNLQDDADSDAVLVALGELEAGEGIGERGVGVVDLGLVW